VVVTWEITSRPLHERDFIGMYEVEMHSQQGESGDHMTLEHGHVTERLLDSRVRGDTSACGGRLQWTLTEDIFPKCKIPRCLQRNQGRLGEKLGGNAMLCSVEEWLKALVHLLLS
jgi:hypothetical protein